MIPDSCPFCEAAVTTMSDGTPCKASNGSWVSFDCLTSIHAGHDQRTGQSRKCEAAERTRLADEVARLRKDDWVGGACLHLMAQHGVPIGSPELLEAKARVEAEIETLRTANAALVDQVKALKAVTEDPQVVAELRSEIARLTRENAEFEAEVTAITREPAEVRCQELAAMLDESGRRNLRLIDRRAELMGAGRALDEALRNLGYLDTPSQLEWRRVLRKKPSDYQPKQPQTPSY